MARKGNKSRALKRTNINVGYSTRSDASTTRYMGREMIATFNGSTGSSVILSPSNSGAPRLTVQSYSWERYRWVRCVVQFVPIVGMNASGNLIAGVDFTSTTTVDPSSRSAVAALSPMVTGPLWDRQNLVIPASRLNTLSWMPICPPGSAVDVEATTSAVLYGNISGSATDQGVDVWLDYVIDFSGPKYPTTTVPTSLSGYYAAIPLHIATYTLNINTGAWSTVEWCAVPALANEITAFGDKFTTTGDSFSVVYVAKHFTADTRTFAFPSAVIATITNGETAGDFDLVSTNGVTYSQYDPAGIVYSMVAYSRAPAITGSSTYTFTGSLTTDYTADNGVYFDLYYLIPPSELEQLITLSPTRALSTRNSSPILPPLTTNR